MVPAHIPSTAPGLHLTPQMAPSTLLVLHQSNPESGRLIKLTKEGDGCLYNASAWWCKVEKLVKLGFEMGAVLEALSQCGDDAKKATLFLVEKEKQAKKMKKQQAKAAAENAKPAEAAATPAPKPKAEEAAAAEASPSSPEVPAASGNKPEPEDLENPKKSKAAPKEQKNPPAKRMPRKKGFQQGNEGKERCQGKEGFQG